MKQLIDKSTLVAEIERLKTIYNDDENIHHIAKYNALANILTFLDTLEIKEIGNNLWKSANSNDLPEINKEVIALIEAFGHYKVTFAHRVDENAEVHTSIDGKPLVLHPMRYDKGGWNQNSVKWWLDLELPKIEE